METYCTLLLNFIYSINNIRLLEKILVILTVRLTFLSNRDLVSINSKCHRLFFSQRAISSRFRAIGLSSLHAEHVSILIANINDQIEMQAVIILVRMHYCKNSRFPPYFSSTEYIKSLLMPTHPGEKSYCPMAPKCQGHCPKGYSNGGMTASSFHSSSRQLLRSSGPSSFSSGSSSLRSSGLVSTTQVPQLPPLYPRTAQLPPLHPTRTGFLTIESLPLEESLDLPSSFDNPTTTNHPSFSKSLLESEDIEDLFSHSDTQKLFFNVIEQSRAMPNSFYRHPEEKVQSKFYESSDYFELVLFDPNKPAYSTRGSYKYLRTNNLLFLIKNIPLWHWFLGCSGQYKTIKGWRFVKLASSSPGFAKYGVPAFNSMLSKEDYYPIVKRSQKAYCEKEVLISPYKGEDVWTFKKRGGVINYQFLHSLNTYLLQKIEEYNFVKIYDVKPLNIMYDEKRKIFELIDFQENKVTWAFCCFSSHKMNLDTQDGLEKSEIHTLADNVVLSTFFLLDKDKIKTRDFFGTFLAQFPATKVGHFFYTYLNETLEYILDH